MNNYVANEAIIYPVFVLGTLTYLIIVFCNLLVLATIAVSKTLHKPMFILLFNLPISDVLGSTAFFPHLLFSIVTQNRVISQSACITQAFLIHFYGSGNMLILSAMAYDRYIAICCPLRYNAIMSPKNVIRIIILIWFLNFSMMTNVVDLINNYFGMLSIVLLMGGPLLMIIYTYAQILRTCVMTNQTDARKKAFQTCGTHLVIFLILQINTIFTLIAHRIQSASPYIRRLLGISVLLFPPFLDPIIYGLKIKELKQRIEMFLKGNIFSTKL
uniref:G-protein coupled receptors family 1 profile domain-containing protein n=1 Tax=Gasterosteus aculeatus aculeatus TaxID=481459 RepID=A0AAQ4P8D6_GASAC